MLPNVGYEECLSKLAANHNGLMMERFFRNPNVLHFLTSQINIGIHQKLPTQKQF
jgi:hypothetical protein